MHATLPKSLLAQEIRKRIEDMEDGEEGSAMPFVMAADDENYLWLDPGALVTLNAKSTFCIRKVRDDYEVIVDPSCNYRWEQGEINHNGDLNQHIIPVSRIEVVDHSRNGQTSEKFYGKV